MRLDAHLGRLLGVLSLAMLMASCSRPPIGDGPPASLPSGPMAPDAVPKVEPRSRYGNPSSYVVFGRSYRVMDSSIGYAERGVASWYGRKFHGRRTSSGEAYDMHEMTAAHRSLPLPTYVEVRNLENGARAVVRVNDRGPFHDNRVIDLSYAAARRLGILANGTGLVEVRAIDPRATLVRPIAASPRRAPVPGAASAGLQPVASRAAAVSRSRDVDGASRSAPPSIFLQAGAFAEPENAQRLRARLLSITDRPVLVQRLASPTMPMHRVRVGPLADVASADRLIQRFEEAGLALPRIVVE